MAFRFEELFRRFYFVLLDLPYRRVAPLALHPPNIEHVAQLFIRHNGTSGAAILKLRAWSR